MLIQKTNPVGIDVMIQKFQTEMHETLMETWGMDVNDPQVNKLYQCHCRCNRNKTKSGNIGEVLIGKKDYKEIYWDDKLTAISFFGQSGPEVHAIGETVPVHLVFFVDVKKLKPGIIHRADEEVRKDVQLFAMQNNWGMKYISTELWIENVLKEYKGSYTNEKLFLRLDMQPVHCFRLNFEL